MAFKFTFFFAKPKTAKAKSEPSAGDKRPLDESRTMEEDEKPKAKRQRIAESPCDETEVDEQSDDDSIGKEEQDGAPSADTHDDVTRPADLDWDSLDSNDEPCPKDPQTESEPPQLPLRPHISIFRQIIMLFSIFLSASFVVLLKMAVTWAGRVPRALFRAADRLNVLRVWTSALVGNLWRILCALAGS